MIPLDLIELSGDKPSHARELRFDDLYDEPIVVESDDRVDVPFGIVTKYQVSNGELDQWMEPRVGQTVEVAQHSLATICEIHPEREVEELIDLSCLANSKSKALKFFPQAIP